MNKLKNEIKDIEKNLKENFRNEDVREILYDLGECDKEKVVKEKEFAAECKEEEESKPRANDISEGIYEELVETRFL